MMYDGDNIADIGFTHTHGGILGNYGPGGGAFVGFQVSSAHTLYGLQGPFGMVARGAGAGIIGGIAYMWNLNFSIQAYEVFLGIGGGGSFYSALTTTSVTVERGTLYANFLRGVFWTLQAIGIAAAVGLLSTVL
jgi:hypothetical protein